MGGLRSMSISYVFCCKNTGERWEKWTMQSLPIYHYTIIPLYILLCIYIYIIPLYHFWLQSHLPRSLSSKATVQGLGSWVSRPSISPKDSVFLKCFGYISMLDYLYTYIYIYIYIYTYIYIHIYISLSLDFLDILWHFPKILKNFPSAGWSQISILL